MSDKKKKAGASKKKKTPVELEAREIQTEETTGHELEASSQEASVGPDDKEPGKEELKLVLDPASLEQASTFDVKTPVIQVAEVLSSEPSMGSLEFYVRDTIPHPPLATLHDAQSSPKTPSEPEGPSFGARPKKFTKSKRKLSKGPLQTTGHVEEICPKLSMVFIEGQKEFFIKKQRVQEVPLANLTDFVQQVEGAVNLDDTMSRLCYLHDSSMLKDINFHITSGPIVKKFGAHRSYLSVCSQIFETIIKFCNENYVTDIIVFGLEPRTFRLLLDFLYTDVINSADEIEILETYDIGQELLVDSLKVTCQNILLGIPFIPENVLFVLRRCMASRMENVKVKCMKFIKLFHTIIDLLQNEDDLQKNVLIEILKCPKLHIPSEIQLLNFVMKWSKDPNAEKEPLEDRLQDVLPYLRYDGFVASEFLELRDLEKAYTFQQIIDVVLYMARQKKELPSWCSTEYLNVKTDSHDPSVPAAEGTSQDPSVPAAEGTSQDSSVPAAEGTSQDPSVPAAEGTSHDPSVPAAEGTSHDPLQVVSKELGKILTKKQKKKASRANAKKTLLMARAVAAEDTSQRKELESGQDSSKPFGISDIVAAQTLRAEAEEAAAEVAEVSRRLHEQTELPYESLEQLKEEVVRVTTKTLRVHSDVQRTIKKTLKVASDSFQELQMVTTLEDTIPDPDGTASAAVSQQFPKTEKKFKIPSARLRLPFSEETETIHSDNTKTKFYAKCDGDVLILGVSLSFKLKNSSKIYVTATGSISDELDTVTVQKKIYFFEGVTSAKRLLMLKFPEPFLLQTGFEFRLKLHIKLDIPRHITLPHYRTSNVEFSSFQPISWTFSCEGSNILAGIYFTNEFTWLL